MLKDLHGDALSRFAAVVIGLAVFLGTSPLAHARNLALVIGNDSYANVTALKTA